MRHSPAILGVLAFLAIAPVAAQAATFNGFLYSKLQSLGTRSEGPAYFLQTFDGKDIAILKHTTMWQQDPALQRLIATKVTIDGDFEGGSIAYRKIRPYTPSFDDLRR
jgi:hypothetical protein